MVFKLPPLPYKKNALVPYLSEETLEFHHGKHHAAYVKKLNELITDSKFAELPLEEIIRQAPKGPIFNNAAQHWNHSFYWQCLKPAGDGRPGSRMADELQRGFGGFDDFKKAFGEAAVSLFGSGWVWLVQKASGSLAIEPLPDAENPLPRGESALLVCDVWEHAYYIDYRNARPSYLEAFWHLVNWEFAAKNLK